jgi:predicted metal-dependent HD superfamily phosphohydrolase
LPDKLFDASSRWDRSWSALQLPAPEVAVRELLLANYRSADRAYHSVQHLAECFARFDEVEALARESGEVQVALWFHDAVYDTHRNDNEAASAAWAGAVTRVAGGTEAVAGRIERLILATRHDAVPSDADQALLVDIDLAILGAPRDRFDEYEVQIRREYSWVPEWEFRAGRSAILQKFLTRPYIYSSAPFQARLESAARANLARALVRLGGAP